MTTTLSAEEMERAEFEAWMLGREHQAIGWIGDSWLRRGDDPANYANDYTHGCWVTWQELRARHPQPECGEVAELKTLSLSDDVREYLQEGINSATQCEDADMDYDFANCLGSLLGPLCRLSDAKRLLAERDAEVERVRQANIDGAAWVGSARLEIDQLRARVGELSDNAREGSATQKAFWSGFEAATLRLFGTNIREAWNSYKATNEFSALTQPSGGKEEV